LHEMLQRENSVSISAIAGMGGIGKTELALQYALKHWREEAYPGGLCWLRAREEVGTQIISFARSCLDLTPPNDLELAEKVRWCWRRWRDGAVLLIFDDVQKYEDVESFLPPQESRFKILMTTRRYLSGSVHSYEIKVLSEPASLELLRSLVSDGRIDQDLAVAKELCKWLGYLPLGLELVGRYLARKKGTSIAKLWQRLQEQKLAAKALMEAEPDMTRSEGVAAVFELSWQELNEDAQRLAALLSLFALTEIPWSMVQQCLPEVNEEALEDLRDEQLVNASLLSFDREGVYQLHQLLREFFAVKREQRSDAEEVQRKFYEVVIAEAERVQEKPERSLLKESTIIIAHLQAVMERLARLEQVLDSATCLFWIAALYSAQGRYGEAEPFSVRSLEIREQQLGAEHLDTATSLNGLATLYQWQGRYSEAEPFFVRSLSIREQQLGAMHPNVAEMLYYLQGRYGEAEPLYLKSLPIQKQQLGTMHPDVALNLNNLASLYYRQERYSKAEPLYLQALSISAEELGEKHPWTQKFHENFRSLLQKAIQENCTHELSNDPMTRSLLQELQTENDQESDDRSEPE
jgi:tetratricopeptide (TPR) repeat protein